MRNCKEIKNQQTGAYKLIRYIEGRIQDDFQFLD